MRNQSHEICQGIVFHVFFFVTIYVVNITAALSGAVAPWRMQRRGRPRPHIRGRRGHFGQSGHGHGVLVLGAVDELLETHGTHRAEGGRPRETEVIL